MLSLRYLFLNIKGKPLNKAITFSSLQQDSKSKTQSPGQKWHKTLAIILHSLVLKESGTKYQ